MAPGGGGDGIRETVRQFCARTGRSELLDQWDSAANQPLTPDGVTAGSHRAVWWVCAKGHRWRAEVKSRTEGSGCPVCANRKALPGCNDLATLRPSLAAQWHPTRNGELTPRDVTAGSSRKVWWVCPRGHVWQAAVSSRSGNGYGCPVCAGKQVLAGFNDLAGGNPQVAAQWDWERNGGKGPQEVSLYSNRKVWWRCDRGHSYRAPVSDRTMEGKGCPYCAGRKVLPGFNDLAATHPEVAAQWHPGLNGALTPEQVTAGSHRKVWWRCPEGHVWQAVVYARTGKRGSGCPVCAGNARQRYWARRAEKTENKEEIRI